MQSLLHAPHLVLSLVPFVSQPSSATSSVLQFRNAPLHVVLHAQILERRTDEELWPYPNYHSLLFQ